MNYKTIEQYNMNTPSRIQFTNGNVTKYVYSATGEKLRTVHQTAAPNITVAMGSKHELTASELLYTDSTDYYCGGKLTMKNGRMDKYFFDGGYAQAKTNETTLTDNFSLYYYNTDHLGNVREVIDEKGDVVQITNYYPFGTPYSAEDSATHNPDQQTHKYNGKEFDTTHGLNTYDYGARQYNSLLGRWDPLCEKYYSVSPYAYCANNPVLCIDEKGEEVKIYVGSRNNPQNSNYYSLATRLAAHDNPNSIMIVAHGGYGKGVEYGMSNSLQINAYDKENKSWKVTDIHNGAEMDKFLSANSKVWQDVKAGRKEASDVQIVLYSCGTGNVAQMISLDENFKDVTFIAPSDKVSTTKKASDVSVRHLNSKGVPLYGTWNTYKNGSLKKQFSGDENLLPGTSDFNSNNNKWWEIWKRW